MEIISEKEKVARNCVITADVACIGAKETLEEFSENGAAVDVRFLCLQKVEVTQALKQRGPTEQQIASLVDDHLQIDDRITQIISQKKNLEKELGRKRKALSDAKKDLKKLQMDKTKMDMPTVASIENMFLNYSISPAAFHGGKLNGVDCRGVMALASTLFEEINQLLLSVPHSEWSAEGTARSNMTIINVITFIETGFNKFQDENEAGYSASK